ncbi:cupin domain-containing protein [Peribacillus deserti]|uniref:Cupin domain-containing protein n=1 Tax=Peribacillus deserti TaxID=673318 RepID=A0A2N5M3Z5_9BACI|nr:cupin domain-containing protein [Peribacillus deserti]PLT29078.1 cupin domain-containing protein [Peribacillus deserti]
MNHTQGKQNLFQLVSEIREYKNFIVSEVNDHVLRAAVIDGEFHWHHHETDELFIVLEGELHIDFDHKETVSLKPGEVYTVPAGVKHRTRSDGRTVNLCFEKNDTDINGV